MEQLWTSVVGVPPDQIDQRPKEGFTSIQGSFEGGALLLTRQPLRTDWVWVINFEPSTELTEFPSIGEFEKVRDPFLSLAKSWLGRTSALVRLAFGGVLVFPVSDKVEGYETLSRLLPSVQIDAVGSSDFHYRINRFRTSKTISGLRLNRLSTWSVALKQRVAAQFLISGNVGEAVSRSTGPGLSACRLEFDINSDPLAQEPIAQNQLVPLLDEFVQLSVELAAKGDVP